MTEDSDRRASDMPLDLLKEREAFVRTFLKKGVEYTETLLSENKQLHGELSQLRADNARLRAHVASEDAIRDLLKTIEKLEDERGQLLRRSSELERVEREHARRQKAVEQEINDLANLYVASFQLHAALSVRRVVRHLCDMMGQLIGAEGFAIYLIDGSDAIPIAVEGLEDDEVEPVKVGGGTPVGDACLTGISRIRERDLVKASREDPLAVIPLLADGRPVGAVELLSLLEQKTDWASVDLELFELIGSQAGVALIAANLYSTRSDPLNALRDLREKL